MGSTFAVDMTVYIPEEATVDQVREALRVAESAFQNALNNTVDAEFGYDETVSEFEAQSSLDDDDDDLEEFEDELDDIDDEDFDEDEDEDEDDMPPELEVVTELTTTAEAIEAIVGKSATSSYIRPAKDESTGFNVSRRFVVFQMEDGEYSEELRVKLNGCPGIIRHLYDNVNYKGATEKAE